MTTPITNTKPQSTFQQFLPFLAAPLFAASLSAILFVTSFLPPARSYETGFPAFFCFLPMAFYFAANAQIESQKQIRALQQRIEQLESQSLITNE